MVKLHLPLQANDLLGESLLLLRLEHLETADMVPMGAVTVDHLHQMAVEAAAGSQEVSLRH